MKRSEACAERLQLPSGREIESHEHASSNDEHAKKPTLAPNNIHRKERRKKSTLLASQPQPRFTQSRGRSICRVWPRLPMPCIMHDTWWGTPKHRM